MISIEMSQCQFNKVAEVIKNEHPEAALTFAEPVGDESKGHIHTSQIDADFEYRQRDNNQGTLVFLNEQKHGMYKMISDDTIGSHLNKLLGGIVCDEPAQRDTADSDVNPLVGTEPIQNEAPVTYPDPIENSHSSFVKPTIKNGETS